MAGEAEGEGLVFHPMDQFIVKPLFGEGPIQWYTPTNATLWMAVTILMVALFFVVGTGKRSIVPSRIQSIAAVWAYPAEKRTTIVLLGTSQGDPKCIKGHDGNGRESRWSKNFNHIHSQNSALAAPSWHVDAVLRASKATRFAAFERSSAISCRIPAPMALEPSRLSEYRVFGSLGAGATSRVVEAVHIATQRRVAIKMLEVLEEEIADELRERFAREALVLSSLESRHVGKILGFGYEKGQPFLVLEHLKGESLDARLKRQGPIPLEVFSRWVPQMIMGVRDFHAIGVIHRDLKPGNIFLQQSANSPDPIVKLIDFGLARTENVAGSLTSKEHVLGSMGYMSPEQLKNPKGVDPQTDLYSLGCVVFRSLSGKLPFQSKSMEEVMKMKAEEDPPPLSSIEGAPGIPELDAFVARAIARRMDARFASAKERSMSPM